MSVDLLARGRWVWTGAPGAAVLEDGAVAIEGGVVREVGSHAALRLKHLAAREIGSPDHAILPGLVNAHQHGMGLPYLLLGAADDALEVWKPRLLGLGAVDPYLNTLYASLRQLESGVTTTLHFNTGAPVNYLETVRAKLKAYGESGIRVAFGMEIYDQQNYVYAPDETFLAGLPADLRRRVVRILGQRRTLPVHEFLDAFNILWGEQRADGRARLFVAPYAPQWCSDSLLRETARLARERGTGLQMHCLETVYQRLYGPRGYGRPVIEHLQKLGILSPAMSLAHGVWVTEREMEILREAGAAVVHNPSSNLRLRSGILPLLHLRMKGVRTGLGMDGLTLNDDDDMFQEMRLALRLHRPPGLGTPALGSEEVLRMATLDGARALGLDGLVGSLEPGKRADLVLLHLDRICEPYCDPDVPPLDLIVHRAKGQDVDAVIVDGQVVIEGRQVRTVDRAEVVARLRDAAAARLTPAAREVRALLADLAPYIQKFFAAWELPAAHSCYGVNSLV